MEKINENSREIILKEKAALLEQQKTIKNKLAKLSNAENELTRAEETSIGMSYWRWKKTQCPDEYAQDLKNPSFEKYLKLNYVRKLFGFPLLPEKRRLYLDKISKNDMMEDGKTKVIGYVKKLGAKWDSKLKLWFAFEGVNFELLKKWNPKPLPAPAPAPAPPSVSIPAGETEKKI